MSEICGEERGDTSVSARVKAGVALGHDVEMGRSSLTDEHVYGWPSLLPLP
jgi:hypothetical protein